ncbi:MAG: dependent oxidoreductase [Paenibacillus sp.]|jgi:hypothetical protein|nr:dependent oxidoreductase [Paenibacillus sp.]
MSKNTIHETVYGTYDVVISGGGLTGIACAAALARAGKKTAIVERRSAFGWETGRARWSTAALASLPFQSALVGELAAELDRWRSNDGGTRASVAELLFDRWAKESGIDVLFHGWSSRIAAAGGVVDGLIVGVREGYRLLQAPIVVETDDTGRLIDSGYSKHAALNGIYRTFHISHASLASAADLTLADGRRLRLRAESDRRACVEIELRGSNKADRLSEFHLSVPEAVQTIRSQVAGCEEAIAYYLAEEESGSPAFQLSDGLDASDSRPIGSLLRANGSGWSSVGLTAGDIAVSANCGLVLAGAWLPCIAAAAADGNPLDAKSASARQAAAVVNRMQLGEAAAAWILSGYGAGRFEQRDAASRQTV